MRTICDVYAGEELTIACATPQLCLRNALPCSSCGDGRPRAQRLYRVCHFGASWVLEYLVASQHCVGGMDTAGMADTDVFALRAARQAKLLAQSYALQHHPYVQFTVAAHRKLQDGCGSGLVRIVCSWPYCALHGNAQRTVQVLVRLSLQTLFCAGRVRCHRTRCCA